MSHFHGKKIKKIKCEQAILSDLHTDNIGAFMNHKKAELIMFFKLRVFHLHTRYNNHRLYWLGTNLNQPNFDIGFLKIA